MKIKLIILTFLLFNIVPSTSSAKLIAYWSFDDKTVNDQSGNGYNGTIIGTPTFEDGASCLGIKIKGEGYYVVEPTVPLGDHILLPFIDFNSMKELTLTIWVREDNMTHYHGEAYIFFGYEDNGWLGISNQSGSNGNLFTRIAVGGTIDKNCIYIPYDYTDRGKWMFYTLIFKNGELKAYKNCKLIGSINTNINISSNYHGGLGTHWWTYSGERRTGARLLGMLDEIRIFDNAITDQEMQDLYNPKPSIKIQSKTSYCEGDSIELSVSGNNFSLTNIHWTGPSGLNQNGVIKIIIPNANKSHSGMYYITAINCAKSVVDSIKIDVYVAPKPQINADRIKICAGDSAILKLDTSYYQISWSTGETSSNIKVKQAGKYTAKVINEFGCEGYTEVTVYPGESPDASIIQIYDSSFCARDSVILQAKKGYPRYEWRYLESDSLISPSSDRIIAKKEGHYYLVLYSKDSCMSISDQQLVLLNKGNIEIEVINEFGYKYLDFDSISIGSNNCLPAIIKNKKGQTVLIKDIFLKKNTYFSIPQSQLPITLLPYSSDTIDICFYPNKYGKQTDTLVIGDSCYLSVFPIKGFGLRDSIQTQSDCDVPVLVITSNFKSKSIRPYSIISNTDNTSIKYLISTDSTTKKQVFYYLYNSVGTCLSNTDNIKSYQSQSSNNIDGTVIISKKQLSGGIYYLIIQYGKERICVPFQL